MALSWCIGQLYLDVTVYRGDQKSVYPGEVIQGLVGSPVRANTENVIAA